MLVLVPRFMAWKLATAFVLTAETWLGPERTRSGEEAVATIGVSHRERLGVMRRVRRIPGLVFMPLFGRNHSTKPIFGCCRQGQWRLRPKKPRCLRPCSVKMASYPRGG
jgi:hypothetical protein